MDSIPLDSKAKNEFYDDTECSLQSDALMDGRNPAVHTSTVQLPTRFKSIEENDHF